MTQDHMPSCGAKLPSEDGPMCALRLGHDGPHQSAGALFIWDLDPCMRCGSTAYRYIDYGGCSDCRSYQERENED